MTPELLREAGQALFGSRWQTDLARALDVSDRTMRYWATGKPVPDGVAMEIRVLLAQRGTAMADVIAKMAD